MNDLRQQQVVAATSTATASSNNNSNNSNSNSSNSPTALSSTSGSSSGSGSNRATTSTKAATAANQQSEEEQRVSSTSSPAQQQQQQQQVEEQQQQLEQPLNELPHAVEEEEDAAAAEQAAADAGEEGRSSTATTTSGSGGGGGGTHSSPAQITSTTASPPQRMRDDETTIGTAQQQQPQQQQQLSSSSSENGGAAAEGGANMAATSLDAHSSGSSGSVNGADGVDPSSSGSHKIILKLSKHATNNESQLSGSLQGGASGDERRVEPLRIHLPSSVASSSSSSACSSSSAPMAAASANMLVPKLTIRPLLKQKQQLDGLVSDASSCSSSCAEDELVGSCLSETLNRPHIVPKLTIRAANEERSVVPKLIIKMPEMLATDAAATTTTATTTTATMNCNSQAAAATPTLPTPTPPLPKLTIKTKMDGNGSESMISSLSPASASSSASCSSSSAAYCSSACSSSSSTSSELSVPKLTIKKSQNPSQELAAGAVPKLMIKTTLAGTSSCISSSASLSINEEQRDQEQLQQPAIPKLTIKTGQLAEHTVIMTHDLNNAQSIPKLTIKTKSIDIDEDKLSSTAAKSPSIPKLTISVGGGAAGVAASDRSSPQSPLGVAKVLRHGVTNSPDRDRIKLTITRQQDHSGGVEEEQRIPKLTIKTGAAVDPLEKQQPQLPKLTIKNLCSPKHKMRAVLEDKPMSKKHPLAANDSQQLAVVINGGESNSSQEFCGFNDGEVEAEPKPVAVAEAELEPADELRRNSDDMDIDDALSKEHDPKMFHNLPPLAAATSNGVVEKQSTPPVAPPQHNIVDLVDLTSSPDSSPAHNSFAGNSNSSSTLPAAAPPAKMLLDCLRMQTQAAAAAQAEKSASASPPANILLSQLTAPPKHFAKTSSSATTTTANKYPQLTERLMANGGAGIGIGVGLGAAVELPPVLAQPAPPPIIDSIEILDTPEGSPQLPAAYLQSLEAEQQQQLSNHVNHQLEAVEDQPIGRLNSNLNLTTDAGVAVNHLKRHAREKSQAELQESPTGMLPNKQRRLDNDENDQYQQNCHEQQQQLLELQQQQQQQLKLGLGMGLTVGGVAHRSRKQKHERILNTDLEDANFPTREANAVQATTTPIEVASNGAIAELDEVNATDVSAAAGGLAAATATAPTVGVAATPPTTGKRRGRPKRNATPIVKELVDSEASPAADATSSAVKSRRVQLLRKRLAIDMVSAEPPPATEAAAIEDETVPAISPDKLLLDEIASAMTTLTPRRDNRQLRATRRTPAATTLTTPNAKSTRKRQSKASAAASLLPALSQFGNDLDAETEAANETNNNSNSNNNMAYALAAQIDLTMCSSSSSTSNGSSMTMTTTLAAGGGVAAGGSAGSTMSASMLPPTTILSSSDPLPDVIFQPNDFSSIMATQQLRSPRNSSNSLSGGSQHDSHEDEDNYSALDNSGDESLSLNSAAVTPTRGRGRGRGSRGGGGQRSSLGGSSSSSSARGASSSAVGPKVPRMSRGASAVAKAIAMSRPRCVGGLKHTPDPERLKGLFSPSPQVFEEDTRMSADMSNSNQSMSLAVMEPPLTPQKQPDFLNNEESQSSIVSNLSMLDSSNQGLSIDASSIIGSALKRPKKKKMEICVAEDTEFKAATIAEYDWPPPKGCCPSKNRDTFMIQEQVALYLGITSFKRKYPDLPRRAVDMEERNWLQEKGLVTEKMCDLGITAVWASDILDIMYADFYDKYEEYKEYIRQKHLREIEAKQKALGLSVGTGRGLQARDRAMLSASKWNVYFNKTRKEERLACLDLQTFTMNLPLPRTSATATQLHRSISDVVLEAAQAEDMPAPPPTLLPPRVFDAAFCDVDYAYPLTLVPGQYASNYRQLTPQELRAYPLNTALDKPLELQARLQQQLQLMAVQKAEPEDVEDEEQAETAATTLLTPRHGKQQPPVRRSRRARQLLRRRSEGDDGDGSSSSDAGSSSGSSSDSQDSDDDSSQSSSCSTSSSSSEEEVEEDGEHRLASCGVCLRTQHRNAKDTPESFIQCYTCRRQVHPSCIEMPHRMVGRVRNYNWQCSECKCCIKCRRPQQTGKMLYCEQCDRGYHIYCLGVKGVPDGRWSCERCSICMRCGATKPEGQPQLASPNGDKSAKPVKHKKVKWINEYRIDHITKLREHCNMLCVPCARVKPAKRQSQVQISSSSSQSALSPSSNNNTATVTTSSTASQTMSKVVMAPPPAAAAAVGADLATPSSKLQLMQRASMTPAQQPQHNITTTTTTTMQSSPTQSSLSRGNSSSNEDALAPPSATPAIGIAPPPVVA